MINGSDIWIKKKKKQPWGADTWNLIIEGDFDYIELAILPVGLHK